VGPGDSVPTARAGLITLAPTCRRRTPAETLVGRLYCPYGGRAVAATGCGGRGSYCGAAGRHRRPGLWVAGAAGLPCWGCGGNGSLDESPICSKALALPNRRGCASTSSDRESPPPASIVWWDMIATGRSGERDLTGFCEQAGGGLDESLAIVFRIPPGRPVRGPQQGGGKLGGTIIPDVGEGKRPTGLAGLAFAAGPGSPIGGFRLWQNSSLNKLPGFPPDGGPGDFLVGIGSWK